MSEQQRSIGPGRRIMLILMFLLGGAVLICGLMAGGSIYVTFRAAQAPAGVAEFFLDALAEDDYDTAYELLSPSFREQFGGATAFANELQGRNIQIASVGTFTQREADEESARMRAPITLEDGARQVASLELTYNEDVERWVVTRFRFE